MKSEKATQVLLLAAGLVFFLVGIFRGEAAVVLSKAIKFSFTSFSIAFVFIITNIHNKMTKP